MQFEVFGILVETEGEKEWMVLLQNRDQEGYYEYMQERKRDTMVITLGVR